MVERMTATPTTQSSLDTLVSSLSRPGLPLLWLIAAAAAATLLACLVPRWRKARRPALGALVALLACGEVLLAWFHWRLYEAMPVVDPSTGALTGRIAAPLWIESEKLYVWALVVGVMALLARRHSERLLPIAGVTTALLALGAITVGRPFTAPLPDLLLSYRSYAAAMSAGGDAAAQAFTQMDGARQSYYNAWYMWVHPPLLFLSYGAFVMSFAASALAMVERRASLETTGYGWARFGYLPLTAGMLLGLPWAIMAWSGQAWWWSGKVNMSLMMWLLYTAFLHGRLYIRREGVWRWVLVLAFLSFAALALTYVTTYLVPGAHSVA